jgi:hypothetical protein
MAEGLILPKEERGAAPHPAKGNAFGNHLI